MILKCQISNEIGAEDTFYQGVASRLMPENFPKLIVKRKYWDAGFEPRWLLVLFAQQYGFGNPKLLPFIRDHKYVGDAIKFSEVIK